MTSLLQEETNEMTHCDRRLSRTARYMIQTQILPIVQHYLNDNGIPIPSKQKKSPLNRIPTKEFDDSIGDTLALAIRMNTNSTSFCPLDPKLDSLRDLERAVLISLPLSKKRSPRSSIAQWFTCGICGKVFATRYYLDLHQQANHLATSMMDTSTSSKVCLGKTVCPALGGCEEQALLLEPYYGRGSGGTGPDAPSIKTEYYRQLPVCNSESMVQRRELCVTVMTECFPKDLALQLQHAVCEHLISCQGKLVGHRHWYSWRDEWEEHYQDHNMGWIGVLIVVGLGVFYLTAFVDRWLDSRGSGSRKNSAGRRLLQKNNRTNAFSVLRTWLERKAGKIKSH